MNKVFPLRVLKSNPGLRSSVLRSFPRSRVRNRDLGIGALESVRIPIQQLAFVQAKRVVRGIGSGSGSVVLRANQNQVRNMSTGIPNPPTQAAPTADVLGIESLNDIKLADGVELSEEKKIIVGSVLDLFAGRPTLKKLSLWSDTASFQDPLTNAHGRKQYTAQWYGLVNVFNPITRLDHLVTSSGNPVALDLKMKYRLKGVGKEIVVASVVEIWVGEGEGENSEEGGKKGDEGESKGGEKDKGKIVMVKDKWNGKIPEGMIATAFRNLNAVAVPLFVSTPKDEENKRQK